MPSAHALPIQANLVKPLAGAKIDWGHPNAPGLVFCCLMNNASMLAETDLVTGRKSTSFSGSNAIASRPIGPAGPTIKTTNGNYTSFGATVPAWSSFTAMTVSSLAFCSNAAGANDEFLMSNYGLFSSNAWIIYNPGGGNYYGAYLNDAFSIYGPDPGAGKWMRVTWTWDGSTVRLYHDAKLVNSGAYAPSPFSNGYIQVGGRNATPTIADAMLWRRALTPREVAELVVNPYEMMDSIGRVWTVKGTQAFTKSLSVTRAPAPAVARKEGFARTRSVTRAPSPALVRRQGRVKVLSLGGDQALLDHFAGANGTVITQHTPDKGGPLWTTPLGLWKLQGNQLSLDTPDAVDNQNYAIIDTGIADGVATCLMVAPTTYNAGLIANYVDTGHLWMVQISHGGIFLFEFDVGGNGINLRASASWNIPDQTFRLRLVTAGDTISLYIDDVLQVSYTGSPRVHKTATKHGLRIFNSDEWADVRYDDYMMGPFAQIKPAPTLARKTAFLRSRTITRTPAPTVARKKAAPRALSVNPGEAYIDLDSLQSNGGGGTLAAGNYDVPLDVPAGYAQWYFWIMSEPKATSDWSGLSLDDVPMTLVAQDALGLKVQSIWAGPVTPGTHSFKLNIGSDSVYTGYSFVADGVRGIGATDSDIGTTETAVMDPGSDPGGINLAVLTLNADASSVLPDSNDEQWELLGNNGGGSNPVLAIGGWWPAGTTNSHSWAWSSATGDQHIGRSISLIPQRWPTVARSVTTTRTAAVTRTPSPTVARTLVLHRTATVTRAPAPTVARRVAANRTLTTTRAPSPTLARLTGFFRSRSVTRSPSPVLAKVQGLARRLSITRTPAPTVARKTAFLRSRSVTVSPSPTLARSQALIRALAVTRAVSPSVARRMAYTRSRSVTVAPGPTLARALVQRRSAAVTVAPAPVVARMGAFARALAVTLAPASTVDANVTSGQVNYERSLSVTRAPSPTLDRALVMARALSVTRTPSPILARRGAHARLLTITRASSPTVQRRAATTRSLSVTRAPTPTVAKVLAYRRALSVVVAPVVTLARSVSASSFVQHLSVFLSVLPVLARRIRYHFVDGFTFDVQDRDTALAVQDRTPEFDVAAAAEDFSVTPSEPDFAVPDVDEDLMVQPVGDDMDVRARP